MGIVVSDDQTVVLTYDSCETVAQGIFHHGVVLDDILIASLQGFDVHYVEHTHLQRILVDFFIDAHLVILNPEDIAVAGDKEQFAIFFIDLSDFSSEQVLTADSFQGNLAVGFSLHLAEVVITAHPDIVVAGTEAHGDTRRSRGTDNSPFSMVVIHQSFEIGHIDDAVFIGLDVEVHVIGMIVLRREIAEEGNALR